MSLQRIGRLAEKVKGELEERIASVVEKTGCSTTDAEWGVRRADSRRKSHCLDDAMRRVRHEGFELPQGETEFRAFRRLRRFVKSSPHLSRLESPE